MLNTIGSNRSHEVFIAMDYCEMSTKGIYSTIATKEAQKNLRLLYMCCSNSLAWLCLLQRKYMLPLNDKTLSSYTRMLRQWKLRSQPRDFTTSKTHNSISSDMNQIRRLNFWWWDFLKNSTYICRFLFDFAVFWLLSLRRCLMTFPSCYELHWVSRQASELHRDHLIHAMQLWCPWCSTYLYQVPKCCVA